jgi:Aldo/keto reductase family
VVIVRQLPSGRGGGSRSDHEHHDGTSASRAGESEEIVGKALAGGRRDDVVLATKFHNPMGEDPNRRGNSRRWIMRAAVEDSLRRLNTDWIARRLQILCDALAVAVGSFAMAEEPDRPTARRTAPSCLAGRHKRISFAAAAVRGRPCRRQRSDPSSDRRRTVSNRFQGARDRAFRCTDALDERRAVLERVRALLQGSIWSRLASESGGVLGVDRRGPADP